MTHPHDPPRQWSRPVEELSRVLRSGGSYEDMAKACFDHLISLGFINENGIEAMKAEKENTGDVK